MAVRLPELPWWRALTTRRSTSAMVDNIAMAVARKVNIPQPMWQSQLVDFCDTTGGLRDRRLIPHPDSNLSDRECLESNFPDYLSPQHRAEALGMCDALEYVLRRSPNAAANLLDPQCLAEARSRLLVVCSPADDAADSAAVNDINSAVASLLEVAPGERVVPAFGVAARSLRALGNGHGRLGEVVCSLVLHATGVAPFPLRVHCVPGGQARWAFANVSERLRQGCTLEELTAFVIERAWFAWSSRDKFERVLASFREGPPLSSRSHLYE